MPMPGASRQATRRHIDDLAGIFFLSSFGHHVTAEKMHLHPLEATTLIGGRKTEFFLCTPLPPLPPPTIRLFGID